MDTGTDYDARTRVSFKLDFDGSGELNLLALPDVQRVFAGHVQNVFQQDDTMVWTMTPMSSLIWTLSGC